MKNIRIRISNQEYTSDELMINIPEEATEHNFKDFSELSMFIATFNALKEAYFHENWMIFANCQRDLKAFIGTEVDLKKYFSL